MQPQPSRWPVMSGVVPFRTEPYTRRSETGHGPWEALHPGLTIILGPDGNRMVPSSYRGGTGKSRLAAEFAARLWAAGGLDLLVWLDAGSRDSIFTGYARALDDIKIAAPAGKPEAAADRFLTWLGETGRRWLVVLDGLVDPADADGLWPQGRSGQSIITTSIAGLSPSPAVTNGAAHNGARPPEVLSVGVAPLSPREALDFLSDRLNDDPYRSAGALDLAVAVQCMPAALTLAATHLVETGQDCRQYRVALERHRPRGADDPGADPLAPCWMLAIERTMQFAPTELTWPALRLAAVLGPGWIPGAVLTSRAACAYVTGRLELMRNDQATVRVAYGDLQQVGLVGIQPADEVRTVRMPAALQHSVRQVMGPAEVSRAVRAAADAIFEAWPEDRAQGQLQQALRECAISVRRCDDQALWNSGGHPLLFRIGQNLDDSGMAETAVSYWRELADRCAGYLGARSPITFQVRERLATAAMTGGHPDEAIGLLERLAADIDEVAGTGSQQAVSTRLRLVMALRTGGRVDDAIVLGSRVAADSDRILGPAHPLTTAVLAELGRAYCDAGQYPMAAGALERCVSVRAQTMGLMHPDTRAARHSLAAAYRQAGRDKDAIRLYQEVVSQLEAGPPAARADAITAREDLAIACYHAGMTEEAVTTLERALAEWRRVPTAGPASSLRARANLASICCLSGRMKEAIRQYQTEADDLERIRGAGHPDLFRARRNLAGAYHKAKRLPEAVELGEATLANCEQLLGPGHRETLTSRANLAHAYHASGKLKRASAQFDRAVRDCERALGPDDPLTSDVRELRGRYLSGRQGAAPIISPPEALWPDRGGEPGPARRAGPGTADQATSNRSRSITLAHAATKSRTNFS